MTKPLTGAGVPSVASVGKGVMGGRVSVATGGGVPDPPTGGIVPGRVTVGVGAMDLFVPRGSPWASTTTTTDADRMEERTMAITAEETFMMYCIVLQ
jgi:hypothetical protein